MPVVRLDLTFQRALAARGIPEPAFFETAGAAALSALENPPERAEVTLRVVGRREGRQLNYRFREIDKPTNVLSFPASGLEAVAPNFLGDIVICAPLVAAEASEQGKLRRAHYAHLLIHGLLHLLGFDHVTAAPAARMERLEQRVMASLGFADPYAA